MKFFLVFYLQISISNIKYHIGEVMTNFISNNEEETKKFAYKLASKLKTR